MRGLQKDMRLLILPESVKIRSKLTELGHRGVCVCMFSFAWFAF